MTMARQSAIARASGFDLAHYCPDWDFMLVWGHSAEFSGCCCEWSDPRNRVLAIIYGNIHEKAFEFLCPEI